MARARASEKEREKLLAAYSRLLAAEADFLRCYNWAMLKPADGDRTPWWRDPITGDARDQLGAVRLQKTRCVDLERQRR